MSTQADPWDTIELEPHEIAQNQISKPQGSSDPWGDVEFKESFGKSILRKIFQIPKGLAQVTGPGLMSNLMHMIASGEALDEEEMDRIKGIYERENIPFDEAEFKQNYQQALNSFPTVNNLARGIEHYTKLPVEARDEVDKFIEFATSAGKITPSGMAFRGTNIQLPKSVLGLGVAATSESLKQVPGMPDWLADLGSFLVLKQPSASAPSISLRKTKPSGVPERGFERLTAPREVSERKLGQINQAIENDFRQSFDRIIAETPVGETFENLKNNPVFKEETKALLNEAQSIADEIPKRSPSRDLKKEYVDIAVKRPKGFALGEYDKNYLKFMKESSSDIVGKEISAGQLVEQYRKNNSALSEYFEPGASKALNRAKRDALLDQNRAIATFMEKHYPDTELVPVFKEGNERWSKIMDAEAVDSFVDDVFGKERIDFKNLRKYFDREGYSRIFKRALGEKGQVQFEQLLKDILGSEAPYKMLKVAKQKGFNDLVNKASYYIINPTAGKAVTLFSSAKAGWKFLLNSLLDKPRLGITLKRGVDNLKKGNFVAAEKDFDKLNEEIKLLSKSDINAPQ